MARSLSGSLTTSDSRGVPVERELINNATLILPRVRGGRGGLIATERGPKGP